VRNRRVALFLGLSLVVSGALLARRADAIYRYFSRQSLAWDLENDPDKWLDQDVTVTDELVFVWPQGPTDSADNTPHLKFDTLYFRCAVPTSAKGDHLEAVWEEAKKGAKDIIDRIEEVNDKQRKREISDKDADDKRKALYWELHAHWKNKPIVTLFGKVKRADFWGPVQGKEEGVRTEQITIVVDRVEKPRDRWYEDLDD
jgi:hypothetical protein